jgi:hypothetical protein
LIIDGPPVTSFRSNNEKAKRSSVGYRATVCSKRVFQEFSKKGLSSEQAVLSGEGKDAAFLLKYN